MIIDYVMLYQCDMCFKWNAHLIRCYDNKDLYEQLNTKGNKINKKCLQCTNNSKFTNIKYDLKENGMKFLHAQNKNDIWC